MRHSVHQLRKKTWISHVNFDDVVITIISSYECKSFDDWYFPLISTSHRHIRKPTKLDKDLFHKDLSVHINRSLIRSFLPVLSHSCSFDTVIQYQSAHHSVHTHIIATSKILNSLPPASVIFVNENENENGEKRENNEFVNEN